MLYIHAHVHPSPFAAVINATLLFSTGNAIHQVSQDIDLYTAGESCMLYFCMPMHGELASRERLFNPPSQFSRLKIAHFSQTQLHSFIVS